MLEKGNVRGKHDSMNAGRYLAWDSWRIDGSVKPQASGR